MPEKEFEITVTRYLEDNGQTIRMVCNHNTHFINLLVKYMYNEGNAFEKFQA
jgi:hypothetical protein